MHGLAVRKQDDAKELALCLQYGAPSSNAAVGLYDFPNRRFNRTLNPFVPNHSPIGALTDRLEVCRGLHGSTLPERGKRLQVASWRSGQSVGTYNGDRARDISESTSRLPSGEPASGRMRSIVDGCGEWKTVRFDRLFKRAGIAIEDHPIDPGQSGKHWSSFDLVTAH